MCPVPQHYDANMLFVLMNALNNSIWGQFYIILGDSRCDIFLVIFGHFFGGLLGGRKR